MMTFFSQKAIHNKINLCPDGQYMNRFAWFSLQEIDTLYLLTLQDLLETTNLKYVLHVLLMSTWIFKR